MTDITTCDILISGGGIAGLTAAAAFGTAGFHVICVDPAPPITDREADGADMRTTAMLQPAREDLLRTRPDYGTDSRPHASALADHAHCRCGRCRRHSLA